MQSHDPNQNVSFSLASLTAKIRAAALAADLPALPLFRAAVTAVTAALLAPASLFGTAYPFGMAFLAAAGELPAAAAALFGTVIGSLSLPDFPEAAFAAILLFLARCGASLFLTTGKKKAARLAPPPGAVSALTKAERWKAILRRLDLTGTGAVRPALAAAAAMTAGTVSLLLRDAYTFRQLLSVFFTAAAAPLCTAVLLPLFDGKSRAPGVPDAGQPGVLLLLFAVTRSLHEARGLPFDAGVVFAFAAPLILAYRAERSGGRGVFVPALSAGLLTGIAMDPGAAPFSAAAALAATLAMRISPAAAVCAAWLSAVGIAFAGGGLAALAAMMPEVTLTAAILAPCFRFSLIPVPKMKTLSSAASSAAVEAAAVADARADTAIRRVQSLAGACGDLSKVFDALSQRLRRPGVQELREICDRAAAARCETCENRTLCWEREYATTADTVCRITAALHRDGRVTAAVIPKHLAARCHHMDGILTEVNDRCAARAAEAAKTDKTDVLSDDLSSFSQILTEAADGVTEQFQKDDLLSMKVRRALRSANFHADSITVYGSRRRHIVARAVDMSRTRLGNEEIRDAFEAAVGGKLTAPTYEIDGTAVIMTMESREALRTEYGCAARAAGEGEASGKTVNGDAAAAFQTEDGRYVSIISDGMGTGGEAAITAKLSVTFLTKMMKSGVSLKVSLTMLNNYLRARNRECSAGMDIMELDLYESEARFVKSGAAPSFVIREGRLFRLASKTVPIGILRALDAEMIRFTVQPGDTVVMLSDGVMSAFDEAAWLCDLLASPAVLREPPEKIAERIVKAAARDSKDDITAAVIRIL